MKIFSKTINEILFAIFMNKTILINILLINYLFNYYKKR